MAFAQQMLKGKQLQGQRLHVPAPPQYRSSASSSSVRCQIAQKKDVYDKEWKKNFFGTGYFLEGSTASDANYLKRIESKQLLTGVERVKLLSKLEKAGLTLTQIEKWKLLSTAENLGALSLLERAFETEPGIIASLSFAPFIASILVLTVIPGENPAIAAFKYLVATVLLGGAGAFVVGGFLLAALNEED